MSILADNQIRDLCVLPSHLTNFESYLKHLDEVGQPLGDGITRLSVVKDLMPDLNPFAAKRKFGDAPAWVKKVVADFKELVLPFDNPPMIEPFVGEQVKEIRRRVLGDEEFESTRVKVISYGLSSYGYDARLSRKIKTFTNINGGIINPKDFDNTLCVTPETFEDQYESDYIIVPANGFVLGSTMEYFRIPKDVTVICLGKSTYARTGLVVNVTPLEAGWEGNVTLELSNTTPLPIQVFLEEGICQFLFFKGDVPCDVSYADRSGKYQGQKDITFPKV